MKESLTGREMLGIDALEVVGQKLADRLGREVTVPPLPFFEFANSIPWYDDPAGPLHIAESTPLTEILHQIAKAWAKREGATTEQAVKFAREVCSSRMGRTCHK